MEEEKLEKSFILELATKRVSIRKFSKKKISFKKILRILEVARQAPSGANTQPWRFIIIDDLKLKKNIRKICEKIEKNFHKKAPLWLKNMVKELA
jgi:nitroreductase